MKTNEMATGFRNWRAECQSPLRCTKNPHVDRLWLVAFRNHVNVREALLLLDVLMPPHQRRLAALLPLRTGGARQAFG
ncbi:MAG TPA: hypothetical protein VE977_10515 [Pyrinomonadaceae bacterium]|nr:hypothetical protein [Pyrinomonadaceae bacterium]